METRNTTETNSNSTQPASPNTTSAMRVEQAINEGNTQRASGRSDRALVCYTLAISLAQKNRELSKYLAQGHNLRGEVFLSKGMLDHAAAEFKKAAMISPGDITIIQNSFKLQNEALLIDFRSYYYQAKKLHQNKQDELADYYYAKTIALGSKLQNRDAHTNFCLSMAHAERGSFFSTKDDLITAKTEFETSLIYKADNMQALQGLLIIEDDPQIKKRYQEKAIAAKKEYLNYLREDALNAEKNHDIADAIENYTLAIHVARSLTTFDAQYEIQAVECLTARSKLYEMQGKHNEAERDRAGAKLLSAQDANISNLLNGILIINDYIDEIIQDLSEYNPTKNKDDLIEPANLIMMTTTALKQNPVDQDKVIDLITQASKLCQLEPNQLNALGKAYFEKNNLPDAITYLTSAIDLALSVSKKPLARSYFLRGDVLHAQGKHQKAKEDIAKGIQLDTDGNALNRLSAIKMMQIYFSYTFKIPAQHPTSSSADTHVKQAEFFLKKYKSNSNLRHLHSAKTHLDLAIALSPTSSTLLIDRSNTLHLLYGKSAIPEILENITTAIWLRNTKLDLSSHDSSPPLLADYYFKRRDIFAASGQFDLALQDHRQGILLLKTAEEKIAANKAIHQSYIAIGNKNLGNSDYKAALTCFKFANQVYSTQESQDKIKLVEKNLADETTLDNKPKQRKIKPSKEEVLSKQEAEKQQKEKELAEQKHEEDALRQKAIEKKEQNKIAKIHAKKERRLARLAAQPSKEEEKAEKIILPPLAEWCIETLEKAGYAETHVEGGYIRDLLNAELTNDADADIKTEADPDTIKKIFAHPINHPDYPELKLVPDEYDPQLFQLKGGPIKIDIRFSEHLANKNLPNPQAENSKHLDLSCNAGCGKHGIFFDPSNKAKHAIKNKILDALDDDRVQALKNNPLIILRTIYFHTKLNGYHIAPELEKAIPLCTEYLLKGIKGSEPPKVNSWLFKLLTTKHALKNLKLLLKLNVFEKLFDCIDITSSDNRKELKKIVKTEMKSSRKRLSNIYDQFLQLSLATVSDEKKEEKRAENKKGNILFETCFRPLTKKTSDSRNGKHPFWNKTSTHPESNTAASHSSAASLTIMSPPFGPE